MNLSWFRDGTKWLASGVGPGDSPASEKAGIWVVSMFGGTPRQLRADADGAVVSPDDRRIAFRTTKGSPEIWLMDTDGGGARRLVAAAPREHFGKLQWSAEGKFLAYMRYGTEPGKEVVIETRAVDGDRTSTVLVEPALRAFCWAPDGRIIFSRRSGPSASEMNLWEQKVSSRTGRASGNPQQITQWAGFAFTDLSVTADSKRLVFIKEAQQTNVYVAAFDARHASLQVPARLTLDEWIDSPSAWTPDGKAVLFYSDRNGNWDIFQQALGSTEAEPVSPGPDDEREPRLSPDRALVLYWDKKSETDSNAKLMRIPLHGGAAEPVLEASAGAHFRCAARPGGGCVLAELSPDGRQLTFSAIDPQTGKERPLPSLSASAKSEWDLAPDGTSIALLDPEDSGRLRLLALDGSEHYLALQPSLPAGTVAWAPDARSLFVVSASVRGSALLNIDLDGKARELWSGKALTLSSPVPSPDGLRIAFAGSTSRTNVWLIDNF